MQTRLPCQSRRTRQVWQEVSMLLTHKSSSESLPSIDQRTLRRESCPLEGRRSSSVVPLEGSSSWDFRSKPRTHTFLLVNKNSYSPRLRDYINTHRQTRDQSCRGKR